MFELKGEIVAVHSRHRDVLMLDTESDSSDRSLRTPHDQLAASHSHSVRRGHVPTIVAQRYAVSCCPAARHNPQTPCHTPWDSGRLLNHFHCFFALCVRSCDKLRTHLATGCDSNHSDCQSALIVPPPTTGIQPQGHVSVTPFRSCGVPSLVSAAAQPADQPLCAGTQTAVPHAHPPDSN